MKTLIPLVLMFCFLGSAAHAAGAVTPESLGAGTAAGFDKALRTPAQPFNSQVRVNLYGNVTLRGNTFILAPSPFGVSVPMTGQGSFASGIVQTGYVTINHTEQVRLYPNQNYVSQMARIQANVPLYCRGQYVGTGMVSGSFMLTGFKSGNYLSLQGSGPLTGSAFVNCPDPNQPGQPRGPELPGRPVRTQEKPQQ